MSSIEHFIPQRNMSASLYVHSIETMGTVDGPGIRVVIFLQGCNLRCLYCHNPDSIEPCTGKLYSVEELFAEIVRYQSFMKNSGGGVTFSGGEPLLQSDALIELIELCKEEGIHTAVDTNGTILNDQSRKVLENVDLILLDIKSSDAQKHLDITGAPIALLHETIEYLSLCATEVWGRYVLLPGYTDTPEHIKDAAQLFKKIKGLSRVEVLPFHVLGIHKWERAGLTYELTDAKVPSDKEVTGAQAQFDTLLF